MTDAGGPGRSRPPRAHRARHDPRAAGRRGGPGRAPSPAPRHVADRHRRAIPPGPRTATSALNPSGSPPCSAGYARRRCGVDRRSPHRRKALSHPRSTGPREPRRIRQPAPPIRKSPHPSESIMGADMGLPALRPDPLPPARRDPQPRLDRRALRIPISRAVPESRPPRRAGRPHGRRPGFVARPPSSERLVGVEFEWLTVCLHDPAAPAAARARPLPSPNPSGPCRTAAASPSNPAARSSCPSVASPGLESIDALADDAAVLGQRARQRRHRRRRDRARATDRRRRVVRSPRYDAMESYFDAVGRRPAAR